MSTTESQEEDWDQDLALPAFTVDWEHLMNQLNQDPREDSVTDSGWGTAAVKEGDVDTVGDKEVEEKDEGATAGAVPKTGIADTTWDPEDPYLEFNDENSSTPQTPTRPYIIDSTFRYSSLHFIHWACCFWYPKQGKCLDAHYNCYVNTQYYKQNATDISSMMLKAIEEEEVEKVLKK